MDRMRLPNVESVDCSQIQSLELNATCWMEKRRRRKKKKKKVWEGTKMKKPRQNQWILQTHGRNVVTKAKWKGHSAKEKGAAQLSDKAVIEFYSNVDIMQTTGSGKSEFYLLSVQEWRERTKNARDMANEQLNLAVCLLARVDGWP